MAGKIPEAFIQQLLDRVDIVDVIQPRVSLKRAGREFQACCPFHNEKTPSFTVSPEKQFYHCFGCGAHGSAIGFLMQFDGLEFTDAVEELAAMVNMEVPREGHYQGPRREVRDLQDLMQQVTRWYRQQLHASDTARDYLQQRGLEQRIIDQYELGYAPEHWDGLLRAFPQQKALLQQGGLLSSNEQGRQYDRFRQRILFPIHNRRGQVIGFGGRLLQGDGPKYLNSPETPLFHKGRELYGLWQARKHEHTREQILVVEGYMDVLALVQAGFGNTVATLGTATTPEQVQLLFRASRHILYCFDGDRAGREAAWKALRNTLPQMQDGRQVSFLFLPQGEDPDSIVQSQGQAGFAQHIQQALPLERYLLEQLTAGKDLSRLDSRAQVAAEAEKLLETLPESHYRQLIGEQIEQQLRVSLHTRHAAPAAEHPRPKTSSLHTPLRTAIALLLDQPKLAFLQATRSIPIEADNPGTRLLSQLLQQITRQPEITTAQLLESWRDRPEGEHLNRLVASRLPKEHREEVFTDALRKIRLQQVSERIQQLQAQLQQSVPDNLALQQLQALLQEKRQLGEKNG